MIDTIQNWIDPFDAIPSVSFYASCVTWTYAGMLTWRLNYPSILYLTTRLLCRSVVYKSISVTGNFLNYNDLSRNIYIVILKHVDNIKYYALVNLTPSPTPEKGEALALMACKKDKIPTYWGKMTGQNPH